VSPILPLGSHPGWQRFGKRYLHFEDFIALCGAVGLHGCGRHELEEYERECWMFPVARMVMPDGCARAFWNHTLQPNVECEFDEEFLAYHKLDWAIRYNIQMPETQVLNLPHPIDTAWGHVGGLQHPIDEEYVPWDSYVIQIEIGGHNTDCPSATHFYHYWQIYELYEVRKRRKGMYKDNALLPGLGGPAHNDPQSLFPMLDAISYFQHLYQSRRALMLEGLQSDDDGWISPTQTQQGELDQAAQQYAADTPRIYELDENALYSGLRRMMELHVRYEEADRVRLAEALKADVWRAVELIHFALGTPTEDIAVRAGRVGGYASNYLELLFPNRREEARNKALRILQNLGREHNVLAPNYSVSNNDLEKLLDYAESTDLAWFEFVMVELNRAHFALHSWRTAEAFLHLRALASFPESLMRTLVVRNGDATTQGDLRNQQNPGMGNLTCLVFRGIKPSILAQYQNAKHWNAREAAEFEKNLQYLVSLISTASTEKVYLGANLALATLLRNFTSHLVVEDPQLLQGQYVRCVRAILSTVFSAWSVAKRKDWT
jgi:hypothetical protein